MTAIVTVIDDKGRVVEANRCVKMRCVGVEEFYECYTLDYNLKVMREENLPHFERKDEEVSRC